MIVVEIKDATHQQLRKHYQETPATRQAFDSIRSSWYDVTGTPWDYDPLAEEYRWWMLKQGFTKMAIGAEDHGL